VLLTLSLFYLTDSLIYHVKTPDFYDDVANNPNLLNRMDTSNLPPDHRCYTLARMKLPGYFKDEIAGRNMHRFIGLRAKSYAYDIEGAINIRSKGVRGHVIRNHLTFDDHMRCLFDDNDDDDDDHDGLDADDYCDKEFDASRGRLIARDCARIVIKRIHRNAAITAIPSTTQHPPPTPPPPPLSIQQQQQQQQQQSYMPYTAYRENISIRSYKHQVSTIRTSKLVLNRFDDKRHILPNRIDTLAHGHYRID